MLSATSAETRVNALRDTVLSRLGEHQTYKRRARLRRTR